MQKCRATAEERIFFWQVGQFCQRSGCSTQGHEDKDQSEFRIGRGGRKKDGNNSVSFSSACTSCRSHHTLQPSLELRQELQENGWYYRSNKTRPNTDFVETPNGRRLKTCKGCRERRTTKEQAKKAETRETNLAANAAAPKICEICTMARDASEFDDLFPERLL